MITFSCQHIVIYFFFESMQATFSQDFTLAKTSNIRHDVSSEKFCLTGLIFILDFPNPQQT